MLVPLRSTDNQRGLVVTASRTSKVSASGIVVVVHCDFAVVGINFHTATAISWNGNGLRTITFARRVSIADFKPGAGLGGAVVRGRTNICIPVALAVGRIRRVAGGIRVTTTSGSGVEADIAGGGSEGDFSEYRQRDHGLWEHHFESDDDEVEISDCLKN